MFYSKPKHRYSEKRLKSSSKRHCNTLQMPSSYESQVRKIFVLNLLLNVIPEKKKLHHHELVWLI